VSSAISDRELIDALGDPEVNAVRRSPYRYATSAALEEVVLVGERGESGALILKDLSRESLLDDARRTKPAFLHEPLRELETYRAIIGPAGIGPRCVAAFSDRERSRHWLLLERVDGVELWQVGEMEVWREVARWLGEFHARYAARLAELREANPHLIEYSPEWFALWRDRARAALSRSADGRAPQLAGALERYDEVIEALGSLPRAFIHGELYPSNVLVVRRAGAVDVRPVDWEMAGTGPGLIDLAALAGGYEAAERRSLAAAYGEGLAVSGAAVPAEPQTGLAACRLHLAIQWLGWSDGWRPPAEHSHDWLGEALALVEELAP
jgi:Ser/Thr protein kinase RdoA (MazF antagonist)